MEKQNFDAGLPSTDAPFNLCVRYGDMIFVSGLPPFDAEYSRQLRDARAACTPIPPFPNPPSGLVDKDSNLITFRFGFYFEISSSPTFRVVRFAN